MGPRDHPDPVADLRRAVQRLSRRLRAERPTDGLTDLQLRALAVLMDHGPQTSAGLAGRMRTTPQALTRTITSLTDESLVHRASVPADKRQYMLTISPQGWRALADNAAPRDAWLDGAMRALTDAERDLLAIAATLMTRLAAAGPAPDTAPDATPENTSDATPDGSPS